MYFPVSMAEHKNKSLSSQLMNVAPSFASDITLLNKMLIYNIEDAGDTASRL